LICPLNWGLGHASRDIPIINEFIKNQFEVIIASEKLPLQLLKSEFPDLHYEIFPSIDISYSKGKFLILKMIISLPRLILCLYKEHKYLKTLINKLNIDIVLSDNRFGLWNKKIYSVFITHQVMVKLPWYCKLLEYPLHKINKFFINKYDLCWIPDLESDNNLSGDLSHKYKNPRKTKYIGPLSRFSINGKSFFPLMQKNDILLILSGPEPQRSIFESILIRQISKTNYNALIIRGKPGSTNDMITEKNIRCESHLNTIDLKQEILSSKYIICRSGYSSIMDLICLQKDAILVPTPGQTEQEYLAKYYKDKGIFYSISQNRFDLTTALNDSEKFDCEIINQDFETYRNEINNLLNLHISETKKK